MHPLVTVIESQRKGTVRGMQYVMLTVRIIHICYLLHLAYNGGLVILKLSPYNIESVQTDMCKITGNQPQYIKS